MKITSNLFEAFCKCPTRCWLLWRGEVGSGNTYADWVRHQNDSYRIEGVSRLQKDLPQNRISIGHPELSDLKSSKWLLATDLIVVAKSHSIESCLHAVERVHGDVDAEHDQLIPVLFVFSHKADVDDKLRLAFDALVLSDHIGRKINTGKIIYGGNYATTKINTAILEAKVKKQLKNIGVILSNNIPPDLILNRYCPKCEFQFSCWKSATENDDLSLLTSMTKAERDQYRNKGIFTVNQLSYTFQPRRTPKRARNTTTKHYPALQALAIRENTIFIHGSPNYPESKTKIYLDIEGLPDHGFYYLIGVLVVSNGYEKFYSLWANNVTEELSVFSDFIELVSTISDYKIFHYGEYEKLALQKVKLKLPEGLHKKMDDILAHLVNMLSLVHSHYYFPTHSNGLKDIGRFLNYEWLSPGASGLSTIIWRNEWEKTHNEQAKNQLTLYNKDDCNALKLLSDFILLSKDPDKFTDKILHNTKFTQDMLKIRPRWRLFTRKPYAIEDLEHVNKCAYFDYQREKIFIRTNSHIKALNNNVQKLSQKESNRPNKAVNIEAKNCPRCRSRKIEKLKEANHDVIDLKFSKGGIRKSITHFSSWTYSCKKCLEEFKSEDRLPNPQKCGHGLASWCVYLNNVCGVNILRIEKTINDVFGISIHNQTIRRSMQYITRQYQTLYDEILQSILSEAVIHIDETTVKLKPLQNGYVWVLTSMDKVYYFYRPTRETSFLKEMLAQFKGVLISDFYTGYDSLPCEQQKCLIHLVRDIDDDILRNPFDNELKGMALAFGTILRKIVNTIDQFGLKRRHLQKHKNEAHQFLTQLSSAEYSSEVAAKYKRRFEKSGPKLFTFLNHDGVPWNNNNAEHAIKRFARHRRYTGAMSTEQTLKEYLILATVFETCEFNNVNVLEFLLSKANTLDGLFKIARRKIRKTRTSITSENFDLSKTVETKTDHGEDESIDKS